MYTPSPSWCLSLVSPVISACIRLHGLFWGLIKVRFFITFIYAFILMRVTKGNGACKISKRKAKTCIWNCGKKNHVCNILEMWKWYIIRSYNFSPSGAMDFFSYMKQKTKNKGIRQRITEMKDHVYSQSEQAMSKSRRVKSAEHEEASVASQSHAWVHVFLSYLTNCNSNVFYCVLLDYLRS